MRSTRFWSAAAVVAALLTVPVTANAAMTTSQVTSPAADPLYIFDDESDAVEQPFTVSGTSDATPGDLADVICSYGTGSWNTIADDVVVGAGGAVTGTGNVSDLPENTCRLRIVPGAPNSALLNRYQGPVVAIQNLQSLSTIATGGPNDGKLYDWQAFVTGGYGEQQIDSISEGAVSEFYPYSPFNFNDDDGAADDVLTLEDTFADGSGDHSGILIDGANAYTPSDAQGLVAGSADFTGWQPVAVTVGIVGGVPTVTETFPIVACTTNTYPADAVSCTNFVSTGVSFQRTYRLSENGAASRVNDVFTSTDGAAHRVQLWYGVNHDDTETGWALNSFEYDRLGEGSRISGVQLPSTPFSVFGREIDDEPEASTETATLGTTFGTSPSALDWAAEDHYDAIYDLQVPAAGTKSLWFAVSASHISKRLAPIALRAEDAFAGPSVAFTAPTAGAVLTATPATVTGTASDNVGVASVTVNGVAATVTGGTWSASVPVNVGANTFTVVAKDAAGNEATAAVAVTYTPTVVGGGPQKVFTGTSGSDKLVGNAEDNTMDGFDGNDNILCGVGGKDTARGGAGNDRIECVESYATGKANKDMVDCGVGRIDVAIVDPFDVVKNCEKVTRVWNGGAIADRWFAVKARDDRFNTLGGNDRVTCNGGIDSANLGAGNDIINCWDPGRPVFKMKSRDYVNCGAGSNDVAVVDKYDIVRFCEKVIRRA